MSETEYLSISGLLKATPSEEGGERLLYIEASNESRDIQGERVLAKSLADSADTFLRYGNIDLDHRTLLPPRGSGDNPYEWEIGKPLEATFEDGRTFVKASLYQGLGVMAERAGMVWDSLTKMSPPKRWYPSIGGQVLERNPSIDPLTKSRVNLITRVRWSNIGLSQSPVNLAVPPVATMPIEVFAKCCTAAGLDLSKALEAGYGTDSAVLSGGGSLRTQSLDPHVQSTLPIDYPRVRDLLASRLQPRALADYLIAELGISADLASDYARAFLRDLLTARTEGTTR